MLTQMIHYEIIKYYQLWIKFQISLEIIDRDIRDPTNILKSIKNETSQQNSVKVIRSFC